MTRSLALLVLLLFAAQLPAAQVAGVRLWTAPDHTRLVFDTTAPNPVFQRAIRWRISLDDLRDGVASPRWSYNPLLTGFSFRFTQGAPGPKMWFAIMRFIA